MTTLKVFPQLREAGGASNVVSGQALAQGATAAASRFGALGAGLDGAKDLYNGSYVGDREEMAIGALKTAALMAVNPLFGTVAYLGVVGYENREAIGSVVSAGRYRLA